jgi:hypothetical protein
MAGKSLELYFIFRKDRGGHDCTYGKKQIITVPNRNNIDFTDIKDNILRFPITNSLKVSNSML